MQRVRLVLRPLKTWLFALGPPKWLWLWPGLRSLWLRGSWTALAIAIVSAWMLCGLLAVTCVWTDLTPAAIRDGGWIAIAALWIVSALWARRAERKNDRSLVSDGGLPQSKDLFSGAMNEYLKGNYLEAERQLRPLVTTDPNDAEARLLLATLLRRVGRIDEASGELQRLLKTDAATDWSCEIKRELAIIQQTLTQQQTATDDSAQNNSNNNSNNSNSNNNNTSADMTKAA